jgi:hypothetical protein
MKVNNITQLQPIGGKVIFSADNGSKVKSIINRVKVKSKIDNICLKHKITGYSLSPIDGKYKQAGKYISEKSYSLEIFGISVNDLILIGQDLCSAFTQDSVLVHLYQDNVACLVSKPVKIRRVA